MPYRGFYFYSPVSQSASSGLPLRPVPRRNAAALLNRTHRHPLRIRAETFHLQ